MPIIAFLKEYGEALDDLKEERKRQEKELADYKRKAKIRRRH